MSLKSRIKESIRQFRDRLFRSYLNQLHDNEEKLKELNRKVDILGELIKEIDDKNKLNIDLLDKNMNGKFLKYEVDLKNNNVELQDMRDRLHNFSINVANNNTELLEMKEAYKNHSINIRNNNIEMEKMRDEHKNYAVNIGNNNTEMGKIREEYKNYSINIRNNNIEMGKIREEYKNYSINIRNNNIEMEKIRDEYISISDKMYKYEKTLAKDHMDIQRLLNINQQNMDSPKTNTLSNYITDNDKAVDQNYNKGSDNIASYSNWNRYSAIDYFDFENHFRGNESAIKLRQQMYIPYFRGKKDVIDIGCGRGEFLMLLKENNINAIGVEIYEDFVQYCNLQELNVVQQDAISYLEISSGVDGIFAGQVIEHMEIGEIIKFCELAHEKLNEDSYLILETPNPTCLSIYANAFYLDPSHIKPIHPLTIKYIVEKIGFRDVQIVYTEASKIKVNIPKIECECEGGEKYQEFNEAMNKVSNLLFGSEDYALIAKK